MAIVAVDFVHFDRSHKAGDEVSDEDPLVIGARHLFIQPEIPEPKTAKPVRIRGPLVDPPKVDKK